MSQLKMGYHFEDILKLYLQSVFPSESFPSWQTINTGLFVFFVNDVSFQGRSINVSGNVLKEYISCMLSKFLFPVLPTVKFCSLACKTLLKRSKTHVQNLNKGP